MESRSAERFALKYFSIWCDWDANEDTDILTAMGLNQSFFKKKFTLFLSPIFYHRLKHGVPDSSGKLPDQKLDD